MKTASLVSAVLLVVTFAGSASAGAFVGLGIGTDVGLEANEPSNRLVAHGRTGRLMAGYALPLATGRIAAEGAYTGFDVDRGGSGSLLWLAARYNFPIDNGFEVFGRLGLQRTSLTADEMAYDTEGTGAVVSIGVEYHPKFKLGVDLSVFVDATYSKATTDNERPDMTTQFFTLGVTAGF